MQSRKPEKRDLLQETLDIRESYVKRFTSSSGLAEQKGTFLTIAKQDAMPNDFRKMSAELESMVEASKKVERILALLREEEKEYEESLKNNELGDTRRKKLKIAVERLKELLRAMGLVNSMLPNFDFNLLKSRLQDLSLKLNSTDTVNTIDFLKFLDNEKILNKYLLDSVEGEITFVSNFKEKMKKLEMDIKIMSASIKRLNLESVENNRKQIMQNNITTHGKIIKILEENAVQGVAQGYANIPSRTEIRNNDDSPPSSNSRSPSSSDKSDNSLSSNSIYKKSETRKENQIDASDDSQDKSCSCLIL